MSIAVLTNSLQNTRARKEMRRRGVDFATPKLERVLRKVHVLGGINVGLVQKSWDVLRTLQFLEDRVEKNAPILDVGASTSEVLLSLRKLGFSSLTGIDLDPAIHQMPHREAIRYVTGDFTQSEFAPESFAAITAISVLEHGYDGPRTFREIARLLKPGGYFVGSTDYWPEKVDTSGVPVYGLDWKIFSKNELLELVAEAGKRALAPAGPINFERPEVTIRWLKRGYTFAWFAFQKASGNTVERDQR